MVKGAASSSQDTAENPGSQGTASFGQRKQGRGVKVLTTNGTRCQTTVPEFS